MQRNLSKEKHDVKTLVFQVKDHHRVTLTKEDFNNYLVDEVTCSVDVGQPLSLVTPIFDQLAYDKSSCGQDGNFGSKVCTSTQQSLQVIGTHEFPICH